jgi:hypothetical protein
VSAKGHFLADLVQPLAEASPSAGWCTR